MIIYKIEQDFLTVPMQMNVKKPAIFNALVKRYLFQGNTKGALRWLRKQGYDKSVHKVSEYTWKRLIGKANKDGIPISIYFHNRGSRI